MLRKLTVPSLVGLLVGLLALTGCGGSDTPDTTGSAGAASLDQVEVTARSGQAPQVTLPTTPFTVDDFKVRLVADGDGAALEPGQGLLTRQLVVSGADGSVLADTWADAPQAGLAVGDDPSANALDQVLAGAHVGAQLLLAQPGTASTPDGTAASTLYLIEVTDAFDQQATGTPVTPAPGLPTVAVDDAGVPTGITTTGEPPATLVVQPLIVGTGAPVAEGQTVVVNYTGWLWDGTQFDSSWDRGAPASFALVAARTSPDGSGLIDGWVEGLAGQPVGSRVLIVVPPDKGYGDQDKGTIPPGSTLVFVVDVLLSE